MKEKTAETIANIIAIIVVSAIIIGGFFIVRSWASNYDQNNQEICEEHNMTAWTGREFCINDGGEAYLISTDGTGQTLLVRYYPK